MQAAKLHNPDGIARLAALSAPNPAILSLQEHETRVNDTLVRKRTQAKIRSDRASISRPQRRRRDQDQLAGDSGHTTRSAARPLLTQGMMSPLPEKFMSPAPRVGEIMSPGPNHPAMLMSLNSFPSRPPIPHQAFSTGSLNNHLGSEGFASPRRASQPDQLRIEDKGPQTFAEMGFVSKPVQDEGCVIM